MAMADFIHVRPRQFGDILYFGVSACEGEEEQIWTSVYSHPNCFKLVLKSQIKDPQTALFLIDTYRGEHILERVKEKRGQVVKPGDNIQLFHVLTQKYISWGENKAVRDLVFNEKEGIAFSFSTTAAKAVLKAGIRENDVVPLQGKQGDASLTLGNDLWFKGTSEDRWVVHRFEDYSKNQKEARYGQVYSLKASNSMHLSVLPNFENSATLLLNEENQSSDCLTNAETLYFPEYLGPLQADLTTKVDGANNFWIFEREDRFKGGFLASECRFYMRHVASNRYLASDLMLVTKAKATTFQFKSIEGEGNIGFSEFADFLNSDNEVVSIDNSLTEESLKTQLFLNVASDLPAGTELRQKLKKGAERSAEEKLKFEVNHVLVEVANTALLLSGFVEPLAELQIALQNITKLENAEEVFRDIDNRIDTNYLKFVNRLFTCRASLSSGMQLHCQFLRIYLLYTYYKADFEEPLGNLLILKDIWNIMMLTQYFREVFYSLWKRTNLIEKCFLTMPVATSDILGYGLLTNIPSERARLHWNDFCMTRKLAEKTQPNFFKICFFLQRLLDRIETPVPKTNLEIVKQDGKFVVQFFYDGRVRFFDEIKPVEELPLSTVTSLRYAVMLFPDLCLDPAMKSELIAGTGLSPQTAVQFYMKKLASWEMNVLLLHFIARVSVSEELNRVPISKILETRVLSWKQIAAVEPIDQKQWFYFPNIDSAIAQLVKDEVYYWLSTVHEINGDPADWYNLAGFHLRFIEKLIDYDSVSDIFVASMMSAASAMMMWVFKQKTEGFSERFPDIAKSKFVTTWNVQLLIETYLELVVVFQQWKMIKALRKIANFGKAEVPQAEITSVLQELTFESILTSYCDQFNMKQAPVMHRGVSLLSSQIEELSPLFDALKKLQMQSSGKVETVLMYIFKNKEYRCRGRPETLLKLIDNEIDMSVHLTTYLTDSMDHELYKEFRSMIEEIRLYTVSLYELETIPGESVKNLPELVTAMETLTHFMLDLSDDFEDNKNFQTLLHKLNFHKDLKRLWEKCSSIGPAFSEIKLCKRLRTLTMELTLLYIHNNLNHRKQVFSILPIEAFYPDYPQFIQLIKEFDMMDIEGEIAANMSDRAFHIANKSDSKRSILAMKELLKNPNDRSKILFTITGCFGKLEKETLSLREWELLLLISRYFTNEDRLKWLKFAIDKWYSVSPECIQKDIAAIFILSSDAESELIPKLLKTVEENLERINSKTIEFFVSAFRYISAIQDGKYALYEKFTNEDARFLLEIMWEKDNNLISILSIFPKGMLKTIMRELCHLYFMILEEPLYGSFAAILASSLKKYYDTPNLDLIDDDLAMMKTMSAISIVELPPKLREMVPPAHSIIEVVEIGSMQRPFLHRLFFEHENQTATEVNLADLSERSKKIEMNLNAKNITKSTFEDLRKWLLEKGIRSEYLQACEKAANLIIPEFISVKKESLEFLIENLLNLAIREDKAEITTYVLKIISIITWKLKKMRDNLLNILKQRRFYLQVFGVFKDLVKHRSVLSSKLNKVANILSSLIRGRSEIAGKINKTQSKEDKSKQFWETIYQNNTEALIAFLSLFQYCCDGCNIPFQEFLRDQGEGTQNNINVVSLVTELMTNALNNHSVASEQLVIEKCCLMLVEALSGPCVDNQKTVCEYPKFLDNVMKFVREISEDRADRSEAKVFVRGVIKVVLALLEGRERNPELIEEIMKSVDFLEFKKLAIKESKQFDSEALRNLSLGTCTEAQRAAFDFTTLCFLVCFNTLPEDSIAEADLNPITKYISSVEIEDADPINSESRIRFLSFSVPPMCRFLTSETAMTLLFDIDRESRQVKLDDFTNKTKICEIEMHHQQALSRIKWLKAITNWWKYYWYLSFALVIFINVMLIMVVEVNRFSRFNIDEKWFLILTPLTFAQITFSLLGTISYYIEYSYTLKTSMNRNLNTTGIEKLPKIDSPGSSLSTYLSQRTTGALLGFDFDEVIKAVIRSAYSVSACFAYWYPFIYPFLLFQIANLNDSVVNILKSISMRGSQLLLTFLFALITIYAFTLIAYFYLYEYYHSEDGLYCDTLADCFFTTLNLGMRSGGGIGDVLGAPHDKHYGFRLVFDLAFYICITTVLMAIVFGLIVDTFSELRDQRNETEFDMNNVCLICGHSRSVIELKGEGWKNHTLFVHNPFAYLYFLIHLSETDEMECSGLEKMVKEKLSKKDISFYPTTSRELGFNIGD